LGLLFRFGLEPEGGGWYASPIEFLFTDHIKESLLNEQAFIVFRVWEKE